MTQAWDGEAGVTAGPVASPASRGVGCAVHAAGRGDSEHRVQATSRANQVGKRIAVEDMEEGVARLARAWNAYAALGVSSARSLDVLV